MNDPFNVCNIFSSIIKYFKWKLEDIIFQGNVGMQFDKQNNMFNIWLIRRTPQRFVPRESG